jgi:hypothetical protein
MAQVVDGLPIMSKALESSPNTTKKKKIGDIF